MSAIHVLTDGNEFVVVQQERIAQEAGIALSTAKSGLQFLSGEGLVLYRAPRDFYSITHVGTVEFERSLRKPNEPTDHFAVTVIQHFNNSTIAIVQAGNRNTAQVVQQVKQDSPELAKILSDIEAASPEYAQEEKRAEIDQHLTDIREEMAKPEADRKPSKLKAYSWAL